VGNSSERLGSKGQAALPREQFSVYMQAQGHAASLLRHLREAWKRPVRHNRQIERAALWYVLDIADDCERLLDPATNGEYLRPNHGDATARYDAEAAIRTIPSISPFTKGERGSLDGNQDWSNYQFEHGIGDVALGQLALVERWHEWLWTPPDSPTERRASPSPDAELLEAACSRLSLGLIAVMEPTEAAWRAAREAHPEGDALS
jgi:hypothetical protein